MRRHPEPATHELADLRLALERAGWRVTRQRAAVYSYLCSVATHPTAEQVYLAVREEVPNISLATVYKALEALVEVKLAAKLADAEGPSRYDCRSENHPICRSSSLPNSSMTCASRASRSPATAWNSSAAIRIVELVLLPSMFGRFPFLWDFARRSSSYGPHTVSCAARLGPSEDGSCQLALDVGGGPRLEFQRVVG
jgi:Fe2+ or Zn2+ uptake regulation protein